MISKDLGRFSGSGEGLDWFCRVAFLRGEFGANRCLEVLFQALMAKANAEPAEDTEGRGGRTGKGQREIRKTKAKDERNGRDVLTQGTQWRAAAAKAEV